MKTDLRRPVARLIARYPVTIAWIATMFVMATLWKLSS